jgi:pimeloyl-ACP methyl ester carboxylesterase
MSGVTHATIAVAALFGEQENMVLVGHSYAGMIITGVAETMEKSISSFVMLDAFFPETGEAPVDLQLNGYTFSRIVVCHLADLTRASRPAPCQGRSVRRSA